MENICNVVIPARDVLITILAFSVGLYTGLIVNAWADRKQREAVHKYLELERLKQVTGG